MVVIIFLMASPFGVKTTNTSNTFLSAISLTRVEVQMQERGDSVRNLAADTSRRLQQLESDVGRIETLLDVVRDESVAIRTGQVFILFKEYIYNIILDYLT